MAQEQHLMAEVPDTSVSPEVNHLGTGLEVQGVSHEFVRQGKSMVVCEDISFTVRPGEFLSIVGPSGCGKTTLLRILGGLIAPSDGQVIIDGEVVTGPGPDRGFVFQQDSLFPWRTTKGNVRFGLEAQAARRSRRERAGWRKTADEQADAAIELVGLKDFGGHFPHELSGGMRQRANLARALAIGPRILLMDEPFSALDAQTREIMQAELLRIWRHNGSTVVFITHQIDEAVFLSDRVIVMSSRPGQICDVVDVDLPRPRDLHVKRTPEFVTHADRIWRHIEQEARFAAMPTTGGS
jgi:NitT/TauT family transport system ATP-binding protein